MTQSDNTDKQKLLRASIKAIVGNAGLSESERATEIQALMSQRNIQVNKEKPAASPLPATQIQRTYNDPALGTLGCPHYQLKAALLAPCCNSWTPCRFCHDEAHSHTMDRFAVSVMACMLCNEEQPISQTCRKCKQEMGRYYCHKCRLIDDGPGKTIFHCDGCGICLSGDRSKYYHCATCDACVATSARGKHGCREKKLHCDCPICGEAILYSTQAIVQTGCQHLLHAACMEQHVKYSFKCPLCSASICDTHQLFKDIERYLKSSTMPRDYQHMQSRIHCNDCRRRSVAKYHFLYHKCGQCFSYNTSVLSTIDGGAVGVDIQ